ncbi:MAG: Gfo/Idh/MocA family protein [Candidatus Hodarchaeota archaeon]
MTHTVGIVGCGFIVNKAHVPSLAKSTNGYVKGFYDIKKDSAEAMKDTYLKLLTKTKHPLLSEAQANTKVYDDLDEMIKDVDIVDIAVPPKYHLEITRKAFNNGKHVICEKPLCRTWWEAKQNEDLVKIAKEKKLVFLMHTQGMFNPLIMTGQGLLHDQKIIGNITKIRTLHQGADPKWTVALASLWDKEHSGGGALMDIGPHAFAGMWYWLNGAKVTSVKSEKIEHVIPERKIAGELTKVKVDDDAHITINWEDASGNKIVGELEATWDKKDWYEGKVGSSLAPDLYYEVHGTDGIFSFPQVKPIPPTVFFKITRQDGSIEKKNFKPPPGGYEEVVFFDEIFHNIDGKVKPRNDLEYAIDMMKVFGAAYLSEKNGRKEVTIDEFTKHCEGIAKGSDDAEKQALDIISDLIAPLEK